MTAAIAMSEFEILINQVRALAGSSCESSRADSHDLMIAVREPIASVSTL